MEKIEAELQDRIHQLVVAIEQNPQKTDNYLELSTVLTENGAANEAVELLTKAQQVVEQPELLELNLAVSYYYLGDFERALAILAASKNQDKYPLETALVYFKLGQFEKALAYLLLEQNQDERYFELLGDIWLALGDLKAAQQSYLKITNPSAKIYFLLGIVTLATDRKQAEAYFAKSKAADLKVYQQLQQQYQDLAQLLTNGKVSS